MRIARILQVLGGALCGVAVVAALTRKEKDEPVTITLPRPINPPYQPARFEIHPKLNKAIVSRLGCMSWTDIARELGCDVDKVIHVARKYGPDAVSKAKALRTAGWKVVDIAEELGVSAGWVGRKTCNPKKERSA